MSDPNSGPCRFSGLTVCNASAENEESGEQGQQKHGSPRGENCRKRSMISGMAA
jgi:hypothetical protein